MLWWCWWLWAVRGGCSEWEGDKEQQAQQHQSRTEHRLLFPSSCSTGAWPCSHESWDLPYVLVLGDISALQRLAHWLRHNFVFLFLLICHYREIILFSGKCVSCLRKYVDIGQPHWCGHCDLGKQSEKTLASGGLFCLAHHTTGVPRNPCNSILVSRIFRVRECSLVS